MLVPFFKKLSPRYQRFTGAFELRKEVSITQAAEYRQLQESVAAATPGNIALSGYKVYSQTDEDGIIDAIFKHIPDGRTFLEIGIQTGVECNTLLLALKGWGGCWVEGDPGYCEVIRQNLGGDEFPNRLKVINSFVRRDNIVHLYRQSCDFLGVPDLDFFSLDIDGNDRHVMKELLDSGARPKVVCVEYNGKFPPPLSLTIRYADDHVWDETDYMGSSLQSFVDLFSEEGYRLITCNIPGINAFFVREDLAHLLPTLTAEQAYQPYRYYLSPFQPAQPPTLRYLHDQLNAPR
jgi:hypothetical protein